MFVILSRGLFFIETKGHLRSVTKIKEGTETTLTHQVSHPVVITPREHAALAQSPRHHYTSSLRAAPAHLLLFFSLVSSFPLAIRSFPPSSIEPAAVNTHELISSPACLMTVFTVTHAASPQTLICGSEANVSHFYTDPLTQFQFILVSKKQLYHWSALPSSPGWRRATHVESGSFSAHTTDANLLLAEQSVESV